MLFNLWPSMCVWTVGSRDPRASPYVQTMSPRRRFLSSIFFSLLVRFTAYIFLFLYKRAKLWSLSFIWGYAVLETTKSYEPGAHVELSFLHLKTKVQDIKTCLMDISKPHIQIVRIWSSQSVRPLIQHQL